jgi:hypothetical protein
MGIAADATQLQKQLKPAAPAGTLARVKARRAVSVLLSLAVVLVANGPAALLHERLAHAHASRAAATELGDDHNYHHDHDHGLEHEAAPAGRASRHARRAVRALRHLRRPCRPPAGVGRAAAG